jgi:hypothetical protein
MKYQVVDRKTNKVVGTYSSKVRARSKADKLDLEYGAYRYSTRIVPDK